MTARILIFTDEQGNPYYLPEQTPPITMREVAQDVLRNFGRRPQDVPLFVDHTWGRAYGWVQALEDRDDGLYAAIELTPEGEQLVESESYKYVSPGLQRDIQLPNGEVLEGWCLVEVSLTNMPAQFGAAVIQLSRMRANNTEDTNMNEQIVGAILEVLTPIQERIERIESLLQQHEQREAEESQRAKESELESTILSWRYEHEQVIPPAIARSYAKLLARLPEHERNDALNLLRNNPPALVPLSRAAQTTTSNAATIDELTAKYAKQLGVSPETLAKYKEVR